MTTREWLFLGGGIVAGVALGAGLPKLRRQLGPMIAEAGHRAGGLVSSLAEALATQMERAEDFAAEKAAESSNPA